MVWNRSEGSSRISTAVRFFQSTSIQSSKLSKNMAKVVEKKKCFINLLRECTEKVWLNTVVDNYVQQRLVKGANVL